MSAPAEHLISVAHLNARIVDFDWPFVAENRTEIAAYWQRRVAEKPAMFNGQVLMQCQGRVAGDRFEADYFRLDFASMVAWQAMGAPATEGAAIRNGFALAALRTRDGAYLTGVMGQHTHNAGKIYFPGGTPDAGDIMADGAVDLAGSVLRELEEETGLRPDEVSAREAWRLVVGRERVAFLRDVFVDLPAAEARALIKDRLSREAQPELDDIAIIRSTADIDRARMPVFMHIFLTQAFET